MPSPQLGYSNEGKGIRGSVGDGRGVSDRTTLRSMPGNRTLRNTGCCEFKGEGCGDLLPLEDSEPSEGVRGVCVCE